MKVCPTCGANMTECVQNVELKFHGKPVIVKNIRCYVCMCGEVVYPASEAQKIVTVIEANTPA